MADAADAVEGVGLADMSAATCWRARDMRALVGKLLVRLAGMTVDGFWATGSESLARKGGTVQGGGKLPVSALAGQDFSWIFLMPHCNFEK